MGVMGEHTAEFVAFAAEESGNVAADGNFSIQVLEECLRVWGLACMPLASSAAIALEARASPLQETAFLLNMDKHWYTLRRLGRDWWRFNSLEAAPAPVSDTYLGALLVQLELEGWTIYVIRGDWPARNSLYGAPSPSGRWLTREQAAEAMAAAARTKVEGRTRSAFNNALARADGGGMLTLRPRHDAFDDGDDEDLRRALAASLGEVDSADWAAPRTQPTRPRLSEDDELARAIAASLQDEPRPEPAPSRAAVRPVQPPAAAPPAAFAEAATAPLPDEPASDAPGVLQLALRLPSGQRVMRRFLPSDTLVTVATVVEAHGVRMATHRLASGFPPAVLAPPSARLADLELQSQSTILVQPK